MILLVVGVLMMLGFGMVQRHFAEAAIARLEGQKGSIETANSELIYVAVALAREPDYFDKPVSHTDIIMELIEATPGNEDLDELGRVREAFRLAQRKDHLAILADYVQDIRFANGCIGLEHASASLSLANGNGIPEMGTITLAALAVQSELDTSETATIARSAKGIARRLYQRDHISNEINQQIQIVDEQRFAVAGSC